MTNSFPSLVAVDTQILIYALREQNKTPEEQLFATRSKNLLRAILKKESKICISSITIAEYLSGIDPSRHAATLKAFTERYEVANFNARAALIAAKLFPVAKSRVKGDRKILLADTKIIASIAAFPCRLIYSNDDEFTQAAGDQLIVKKLPAENYLFDKDED